MTRPKGNQAVYVLSYEECRELIDHMRFGDESMLFGNEKDASFKGSIGAIYQSFDGKDLCLTLEEKADHHDCGVESGGEGDDDQRDYELHEVTDKIVMLNSS